MSRKCITKVERTGKPCSAYPLKNEKYCLFHSQSERGKALREEGRKKPKGSMSREKLLKILVREIEKAQEIKDDETRLKIINSLSEKIILLQDKLQRLSELEKLIKDNR